MKYGNTKCTARDGTRFPSVKEMRRYEDLLLLQRIGEISNLEIQVKYPLLPGQVLPCGKKERPVDYIADFTYRDKLGVLIVEDTKGMRTREYILKRKLMLYIHRIAILET